MTIEQLISEFQAKGILRPEVAVWIRNVYNYEMSKHGDDGRARRVLVELLSRTPEEHRQKIAEARATVADAIARKPLVRSPVPTFVKVLQAAVGCAAGAVAAMVTVFVFFYSVMYLIEMIFGSTPSRVRVPLKGALAALVAPIAGAVLGGAFGWRFDARGAADRLQRFLNTISMLHRACIAWGVVWTAVFLIAFTLFDPFDYYSFRYWGPRDLVRFALLWVGPIVGGWVIARLVQWVSSGQRD
jgi:hypothetical protein